MRNWFGPEAGPRLTPTPAAPVAVSSVQAALSRPLSRPQSLPAVIGGTTAVASSALTKSGRTQGLDRIWRDGLWLVTGLLALLAAAELVVMFRNPTIMPDMVGADYGLYMNATRRWLAGGDFYPAWQLVGSYTQAQAPILYPPQALLLFVPFTFLPALVWFAVPTLLTVWIVIDHRPRLWTWPILLALFAFWPMNWLPYISGTPTIWIVAALAAGTRWGWPAALVFVKPSLAPFALVGIRHRGWWAIAGALAILGVVVAPMTLDWVRSVMNLTGSKSGALYSLENVPVIAMPLVAWTGGRRRWRHPKLIEATR